MLHDLVDLLVDELVDWHQMTLAFVFPHQLLLSEYVVGTNDTHEEHASENNEVQPVLMFLSSNLKLAPPVVPEAPSNTADEDEDGNEESCVGLKSQTHQEFWSVGRHGPASASICVLMIILKNFPN